MSWAKFDDNFANHPKISELGSLAIPGGWLFVCGTLYCAKFLTDGYIPLRQVVMLTSFEGLVADDEPVTLKRVIDALLDVGLWEEAEGGYQVHDYLKYNPSKEKAQTLKEHRSQLGSIGAQKRWAVADDGKGHSKTHGKRDGKTDGKTIAVPVPVPRPVPQETEETEEMKGNARARESARPFTREDLQAVQVQYETIVGNLVPAGVSALLADHPADRLIEAIKRAAASEKTTVAYIRGIAQGLARDGWQPAPVITQTRDNPYDELEAQDEA